MCCGAVWFGGVQSGYVFFDLCVVPMLFDPFVEYVFGVVVASCAVWASAAREAVVCVGVKRVVASGTVVVCFGRVPGACGSGS